MAEEQQATTPKALWMLIIIAPVIVAIHHETNFVLVRHACSAQRNVALYLVTIISLILTISTALVAVRVWQKAGVVWSSDADDLATRIRFVSMLGILSSVMSFLVIFAQGIATVHFDPCQF